MKANALFTAEKLRRSGLRRVFQICLQFPPDPAGDEDFDAVQRKEHERARGERGDKAAADYDRHPVCSVGVE